MVSPRQPLTLADIDRSDLTPEQKAKARGYFMQGGPILTNQIMFEKYEKALNLEIRESMWVSLNSMNTFGVYDDFIDLSLRAGIGMNFWDIRAFTYASLTREFIASLELKEIKGIGWVFYQLGNIPFIERIGDFGNKFGFPKINVLHDYGLTTQERAEFWKSISGRENLGFNPEMWKINHIQHPSIRITFQIWKAMLFPRALPHKRIHEEEMTLLSLALATDEHYQFPNTTQFFIDHFNSLLHSGEPCYMGKYVTFLAEKNNIDLRFYNPTLEVGFNVIGEDFLLRNHIVKTRRGSFYMSQKEFGCTTLPFQAPIRFSNPRTLLLYDDNFAPLYEQESEGSNSDGSIGPADSSNT